MTVPHWSEASRSDIVDVSQCSILEGEDDAPLLIALTLRWYAVAETRTGRGQLTDDRWMISRESLSNLLSINPPYSPSLADIDLLT